VVVRPEEWTEASRPVDLRFSRENTIRCNRVATSCNEHFRAAFPAPDNRRRIMGKYVLGWLLGVPFIVLVVLYLIFH